MWAVIRRASDVDTEGGAPGTRGSESGRIGRERCRSRRSLDACEEERRHSWRGEKEDFGEEEGGLQEGEVGTLESNCQH